MSRYINKDWLLAEANMDGAYGYVGADQIVKAPTDNVVDVVRCKDCKWWKTNYYWNGRECKVCVKEAYTPIRTQDDFCSYGERREDGELY